MKRLIGKLKRNFSPLAKLWKTRHKLAENRLSTDLKSFLPPALEVVEKPPHPAPRILLVVVTAICLIGLLWSIVGKVDVITVAEGKIIPSGKIKEIQPYDRGVISRILVTEGQLVEEGEPLIELDRTQTSAETARLASDSFFISQKKMRRELLLELLALPVGELATGDAIKKHPKLAGDREEAEQLFEEYMNVVSQWESLESQLKERQADWRSSQEIIKQLTATLPLIEQRLSSVESLYKRRLVTQTEYLALEEERLRQFHGLEAEKSRADQLAAAIVSVEKQIEAQKAQSRSELLGEIDDLVRQAETINQELAKVKDLSDKQILYAPVRGTVKGLVINTVGGVVSPAQVLMEVVPLGEQLEVEAFVSNQDIGYVVAGQRAEIKVHTFPFTKYGIIDATVENVADDATIDEKLGLIYRIKLLLKKTTISVDGKELPLMPGMAVSAEIATDQRRLIEFFLAPLLKMKQESFRER